MKILHVIPNLLKGGAQRLVIDICNELSIKESLECKILVLSKTNNDFHYCSSTLDITYCSVSFKLSIFKKNQINIDSYESFIDDFKPDIIHSHLYFSELVCHENPRSKIKYVSHLHSNNPILKKPTLNSILNFNSIYQTYERYRLLKKYRNTKKQYISISSYTTNYFNKNIPKHSKDLIKLQNTIKLERFKKDAKNKNLTTIKLISIGNLLANKNHIFLLDIVKYIKSKNFTVFLNIVGEGKEKSRIQKKVKTLKLEDNVKLSGQLNLIEKEIIKYDFYVHTAINEAFGLVILEAMASRLPVITLNGSGNADLIKDKINGYLIEDQDPVKFGDIIIDLFQNKEKYKSISMNGFETCANYDIKIYINKLLNIYTN
ncbi:glycosyltransferase [bacterium]|nr:glycosyltransferase [bacterium]